MGVLETRKWLERNKIFFEIFAILCLSGMSLIVSIGSYKTAQFQAQLEKSQNLPIINIQRLNNDRADVISIYNNGGKISNFNYDYRTFLEISLSNNKEELLIPIIYYYNDPIVNPTLSGELLTMDSDCASNLNQVINI